MHLKGEVKNQVTLEVVLEVIAVAKIVKIIAKFMKKLKKIQKIMIRNWEIQKKYFVVNQQYE
jgi:hypothetical protein